MVNLGNVQDGLIFLFILDKMLEHFQIGLDECMAFGDGGNDIQMLSHVGIGIAMGNASDEVKKYADYITDSVDEDGVFKVYGAPLAIGKPSVV